VKAFHGNFLVVVRALAYLLSLGAQGVRETAGAAVLQRQLYEKEADRRVMFPLIDGFCMHEFV
jgi:glycine dehydrogenase subunit 2